MQCPKCRYENREGAKFCIKCGRKFEVKCPDCGNSLPSEALFCDECGHSFVEAKEAPSVDYSEPQSYTQAICGKNSASVCVSRASEVSPAARDANPGGELNIGEP